MADFDIAVDYVLQNEGGMVDNPNDPGGVTRYGISQRAYPNVDIASLTLDDAKAIYRRDYWTFDDVKSQAVANKLLDMCAQFGVMGALNAVNAAEYSRTRPWTAWISLFNSWDESYVLRVLRRAAALCYCDIFIKEPSDKQFAHGWLWRAVQ